MAGQHLIPNPFVPKQKDPWRTYEPLTIPERLRLNQAPKLERKGTQVTVRAYDIKNLLGRQHMYVEYDDGRNQLIARGGPSAEGPGFLNQVIGGRLRVTGGVSPAKLNRDYGKGERVVFQGFIPNISAEQAAEPARRNSRALQDQPRRYGWLANSNSYAADAVEPLFGVRPGDALTPGRGYRLKDAQPITPWLVKSATR